MRPPPGLSVPATLLGLALLPAVAAPRSAGRDPGPDDTCLDRFADGAALPGQG